LKKSRYDILLLVLLLFIGTESLAQRRKKSDMPAIASIKQREAEFHFTEGEKYFILEDYAKALVYYQKALELNPQNATIHYKVAQVLSMSDKQDDLTRAALSIDQALKLEKANKFFYLLAAEIYSNLTRFDKAAQAYESLIRNIPDTEEYLYELAAVYQYDNQTDEATRALKATPCWPAAPRRKARKTACLASR
jgi:tetratricopeptide (TPR) repeat protein